MNDRIKQLVLKAYNNAGQGTPDELSLFMQVYSEKFAELIVQECAGIYDKIDNGNLHLGTYNYLKALQKHFGVEQ